MKNKKWKRKAKRLYGHCHNTICPQCKYVEYFPEYYMGEEVGYYTCCSQCYEGESLRELERWFKNENN